MSYQTAYEFVPLGGFAGTNLGGNPVRTVIPASFFATAQGPNVRLTLSASVSEAMNLVRAFVALSASSYDAQAPLVPVTFGGQAAVVVPVGQSLVSDDLDLAIDGTDALIISFEMASVANCEGASRSVDPTIRTYASTSNVADDLTWNAPDVLDLNAIFSNDEQFAWTKVEVGTADVVPEEDPVIRSPHNRIEEALVNYAKTFPWSPEIPIVENTEKPYKPTLGQEYLEVRHFVAPTETIAVTRGKKRYTGILQVTVVYPIKAGTLLAKTLGDAVIDHFEEGTKIDGDGVRIKINRQPDQATPTPDGAWLRVPVSINYQCMA